MARADKALAALLAALLKPHEIQIDDVKHKLTGDDGLTGWGQEADGDMLVLTAHVGGRRLVIDRAGQRFKILRRQGAARWRLAIDWHPGDYKGVAGAPRLALDAITLLKSMR